jgi:hypothetical protein
MGSADFAAQLLVVVTQTAKDQARVVGWCRD